MSNLPATLKANVSKYAYGFARGKDAFADMFLDAFRYTTTANETVTNYLARDLYTETRLAAELIAKESHKPLKPQNAKSEKSQVSKLQNAVTLGNLCRDKNAEIADAMDAAARKCEGGYTKLVKCAVAVKALFVDVDPASVTLDAMLEAINDALVTEPDTASEAVAKIAKAWEALTEGKNEEPSPYADHFVALRQRHPADWAQTIAVNFDAIVKVFKSWEDEAELAKSIAAAK